jgi:hypothetical protein
MDFLMPLGLWGLLALPLLIGIYFLRQQFKRRRVSALFLWRDQLQDLRKGTHVETFKPSVLFFLEFLAILLLVLAAAKPVRTSLRNGRELFVILDDSYSMQAGRDESARDRSRRALQKELALREGFPVTFLRAGRIPEILARATTSPDEIGAALDQWHCLSDQANLGGAMVFAADLSRGRGDLLVLTDREPGSGTYLLPGVKWQAHGRPLGNLAFTKGFRVPRRAFDVVQFEIENFSTEPREIELVISGGNPRQELRREKLSIESRGFRRISADVDSKLLYVQAELPDDHLSLDNRLFLVKNPRPPMRVDLQVTDPVLRGILTKAVEASDLAVISEKKPHMRIVQVEAPPLASSPPPKTGFRVNVISGKKPQSYVGPFIQDHTNALTDGLHLEGVLWGADPGLVLPGMPVIGAGNIALLTQRQAGSGFELNMQLAPEASTLQYSTDWPILWWNILRLRQSGFSGWESENLRLGGICRLRLSEGVSEVQLRQAVGGAEIQAGRILDGVAEFDSPGPGLFIGKAAEDEPYLAINTLQVAESNVTGAAAGEWGSWIQTENPVVATMYSFAWLLLLSALALLTLHHYLMAREPAGMPA